MTVQSIYQSFLTFADGWSPIVCVENAVMGEIITVFDFYFVDFMSCKYYMMMFYFLLFEFFFF